MSIDPVADPLLSLLELTIEENAIHSSDRNLSVYPQYSFAVLPTLQAIQSAVIAIQQTLSSVDPVTEPLAFSLTVLPADARSSHP